MESEIGWIVESPHHPEVASMYRGEGAEERARRSIEGPWGGLGWRVYAVRIEVVPAVVVEVTP